ncbi:MAG TPA: methyltransferase domain-containing protein [Sandaracinaceae bacterium LLY-WYZ-13_1]|nr:methyltransferase domain-containing protein [Sandaracinaceae bacterium LLY-WYZ-13_1]
MASPLSPVTRLWNDRVLPVAVELVCAQGPIDRQRAKVVPEAEGRVLELGVGSGLNFEHYDPARVEAVVGLDPSGPLLAKARPRAGRHRFDVELVEGSAEAIPHPEESFDTVVVTYSLCSIPDPARALAEIRRVLRTTGRLVFSEHGRAPDAWPHFTQRRLNPMWSRLGGGCHLDRDVPTLLASAGFDTAGVESMYLPGPRWLNYHYWGVLSVEAAS